jgi:HK97 family phage major capsid protein
MSKEANELRRRYNEAVETMKKTHEAAEKEDRGLTADELVVWNAAKAEIDALKVRIERAAAMGEELIRRSQMLPAGAEGTADDIDARDFMGKAPDKAADPYHGAFRSYLQRGTSDMAEEHRKVLVEKRDLSLTGASGGFTVPQRFYNTLIETQRLWGGFVEPSVSTVIDTDTGNSIPVPLEDDTANAAAIVAEGASLTTSTDSVFATVTLNAFMYRALVRVSLELLQDSAFDLEGYLNRKLAIRLWRGFNANATTGTGTGQPQGLFNASVGATIGHTAAAGNTLQFPYASLVALEHSVDPIYRRSPNCLWMFSDGVLQGLKTQLDTTNRPIWMPDYTVAAGNNGVAFPGTILGYRYQINPDAPVMAANARSVAFGDFAYYMVRRVRGMSMVRAQERFIDQGQIGFYLFARMDGRFGNPTATAARSPIRLGQNSAT